MKPRRVRLPSGSCAARRPEGFGESMLRTWLVVSNLNRRSLDPRRQPTVRARIP